MAMMRRADLTVDWRMEFGMLNTALWRTHTYDFFLADLQNTTWQFKIYTGNFEGEVSIVACIGRSLEDVLGPKKIEIDCDLDLLLAQQEPDTPRSLRRKSPVKVAKKSFERGGMSDWDTLIFLKALTAVEDDDLLLFRCRIWPRDSSPFLHPVRHLVRSDWGGIGCFSWTVKDFPSLQKEDRVKHVLKKKDEYFFNLAFDLFLGNDNDSIYIQERSGEKDYCIRCISVLDARGGKTPCLQNCNPSKLSIKTALRRSKLLEDRKNFLPNNQLTLIFELRKFTFEGVLKKIIMGDSQNGMTAPNTRKSPHSCPAGDLYNLFRDGLLTDFELRIGSETIRVHKNILAARSSVFLAMLTNDMREASQHSVDIKDVELDTAKHLLDFVYLDSVPDLDWNSAIKLYSVANKYDIMGLRNKCSEILKSKLCVENLCSILSLADRHEDADLKGFVQKFLLKIRPM